MVINKFLSNKLGDLNTRSRVVRTCSKTAVAVCSISNEMMMMMPPPPLVSPSRQTEVRPDCEFLIWACDAQHIPSPRFTLFCSKSVCQFTVLNLRSPIFGFNTLWLPAFCCANPLFLMRISFLIYAHFFRNAAGALTIVLRVVLYECETWSLINSKRFWRWCIILCGDGFMDFIRRPKSKILKMLKN
jgi:hypothetical protein